MQRSTEYTTHNSKLNQVGNRGMLEMITNTITGEIVMARPKKNGTYLNVCIETPIYERLVSLCDDAGQTKTVVVERALVAYFNDYEKTQRQLKMLNESMPENGKGGLL